MPVHFPDNPAFCYRIAEVRALERALIDSGIESFSLMQRAALACLEAIKAHWPEQRTITVLTGAGNNAGDGFLLAKLAHQEGYKVQLLFVREPSALVGDAQRAVAAACEAGVALARWQARAELEGVLVDALLGIGLNGQLRGPYPQVIEAINQSGLPVLAVDIPSGLCADTGAVLGAAVVAEVTVTMVANKVGLCLGSGREHAGQVVLASLRQEAEKGLELAPALIRLNAAQLPKVAARNRGTHKGQCGHVLVIGGDRGTGGAPLLSAEMALRAGAGLVSLATRQEHIPAALARIPQVMCQGVSSAAPVLALINKASVLVVGPGLGTAAWGRSLLSAVASCALTQVWDADALNLVEAGFKLPTSAVITPHPGEAARLLGISTASVQADRLRALAALVERYQCVVVLKGAGSLIGAPNQPSWLCEAGHPVMAGAGLGDVLAGLIGALIAQGLDGYNAAKLAVWVHAKAGEYQAHLGRGLAAQDLIMPIRALLEEQSPCLN